MLVLPVRRLPFGQTPCAGCGRVLLAQENTLKEGNQHEKENA